MSTGELLRGLLAAAIALAALAADAAPNFPERYIDPDDMAVDEDEGGDAAWPGGLTAFEGLPYDVYDGQGIVDRMDPAGPTVVIEGVEYGFSLTPDIRLRTGAGAPTLLAPGMVLEYYFAETGGDDLAGTIVAAIELDPAMAEPE